MASSAKSAVAARAMSSSNSTDAEYLKKIIMQSDNSQEKKNALLASIDKELEVAKQEEAGKKPSGNLADMLAGLEDEFEIEKADEVLLNN